MLSSSPENCGLRILQSFHRVAAETPLPLVNGCIYWSAWTSQLPRHSGGQLHSSLTFLLSDHSCATFLLPKWQAASLAPSEPTTGTFLDCWPGIRP